MRTVRQLIEPTPAEIAQVLELFKQIPGRTCSAAAYLDYLNEYWDRIGLFVVQDDDIILAFTQAEAPSILEPRHAWLPFSRNLGATRSEAKELLNYAEAWMFARGATHWKMTSIRNPAPLIRAWGVELAEEKLYVKEIKQ